MKPLHRSMVRGVAVVAMAGALAACSGGIDSAPAVASIAGTTSVGTTPSPARGAPPATATESNPAGDIPDSQAFVDYTPAVGGYSVKVPEGWARTESAASVLFSDKYNSITIDATAAAAAPVAAAGQAELTALAATATGFTAGTVSTVERAAGPVLLITYRADSPVNAVTGKVVSQDVERYEFWNRGRLVTLTLAAPVGSDNVDPWRTVTDSLQWSA